MHRLEFRCPDCGVTLSGEARGKILPRGEVGVIYLKDSHNVSVGEVNLTGDADYLIRSEDSSSIRTGTINVRGGVRNVLDTKRSHTIELGAVNIDSSEVALAEIASRKAPPAESKGWTKRFIASITQHSPGWLVACLSYIWGVISNLHTPH